MLTVGLAASAAVWVQVRDRTIEDAAEQFAFSCDQIAERIRERLISHELVLRGGAALFAATGDVRREQWRAYVSTLHAHEVAVRREGLGSYSVRPAGTREIYSSIVYLEPFRDLNHRALGFDMFSEPVRRAAMERARDSGRAALSGKVTLVQEPDPVNAQAGTLMYVPVYRDGKAPADPTLRRTALIGWSYSPFRMNDLMAGILQGWQRKEGAYIDLRIFDGACPVAENLIYGSLSTRVMDPAFHRRRLVDFNGQRWTLEFVRNANAPGVDLSAAWAGAAGTLGICVLLSALLFSQSSTRARALRLANRLTVDLENRERLLEESEQRWRFALEGAGDGVWDWDLTSDSVHYSSRWKSMLGYGEDEVGNSLEEWSSRVHPEDLESASTATRTYLEGRTPGYQHEHRMRCRDGGYKWILDRGMIVSRDDDGKPTRMIGTHTDISRAKALEDSLRENQVELHEAQRLTHAGSWRFDPAAGRMAWSEEMFRIFGLEPDSDSDNGNGNDRKVEPFLASGSAGTYAQAMQRLASDGTSYELELESVRADGSRGWILARGEAVRAADGRTVALRGIALDITERIEAAIRIEHLTRLHSALSAFSAAILHCTTDEALFARVCEVVVEHGGMRMAWIGLYDEATGLVVPTRSHGFGAEYLDGIRITVDENDPNGRGATGTAIRENRPVWFDEFEHNPNTAPWRERARSFGWKASAALPIVRGGRVIGALTFYSGTSGWFSSEIRDLLLQMTSELAFALDKFAIEAEARSYQTNLVESEQRFRSLVEQSIAGAFIVQAGAFVYVNPRMQEILGNRGPEDLIGRDPIDSVDPKDRSMVQAVLAGLVSGERERAEFVFTARRVDGTPVEVGVHSSVARYRSEPAIIGLMQDISDRKVAQEQILRYAHQLEHTFMQAVGLATTLSEMRDPYTAGHERRVAEIAVAIGEELGLDAERLTGLRVGGYLHDVGKITIPTEILVKPTRLTPLQYALIKEHAQAGYNVLKGVEFPWPVAQIALQHHERYDGSGYPQGLEGEEILLEARIVAVADVVESMASHRPYRPGLGLEKALAEIERGAGTAYAPDVANACLTLFREKGFRLPG